MVYFNGKKILFSQQINMEAIKDGSGKKSVVIGEGDAIGDYSIAGGTNDKDLIGGIVGGGLASLVSINKAKAEAALSISFGAGTISHTPGSVAIGVNSTAGCKGFYWTKVSGNTLTLSTEQPTILSSSAKWDATAQAQLDGWKIGDVISIENDGGYSATITEINNTDTAATITVESLPFSSKATVLVPLVNDFTVTNPSRPGYGTVELGFGAIALGYQNNSANFFSFAEGRENFASGQSAHAEGRETRATGGESHSEGYITTASGYCSHSEGKETTASQYCSHAEGSQTNATGSSAHAEGHATNASGNNSHAEGNGSSATGNGSHAEGHATNATGENSHAEGSKNNATGKCSHAEGRNTKATGQCTHAEGSYTNANGDYSHAEGYDSSAEGEFSHAEGRSSVAMTVCQHVQGIYNLRDTDPDYFPEFPGMGRYAHIVGNGAPNARSNAHTVDWKGNGWFAGTVEGTALILPSPNGTRFQITVDDAGVLIATKLVET